MKYLNSVALAGMVAFSASANADVVNGGFANGMNGWTITGSGTTPGIGVVSIATNGSDTTGYGDHVPSHNGSTHAAFFVDDNAVETISQHVTLNPNSHYGLSFSVFATLSGAANNFPYVFLTSLTANQPGPVFTSYNNDSFTPGTWVDVYREFNTTSATDYLLSFKFTSGSTPAKDLLLTNVSVPEPTSLALLGLGTLAMGAVAKRRKSV